MSERTSDSKVQLGCGTLIVIALIVMFFSGGRDSDELRRSVDELNAKVDRLEKKIDELSEKADRAAQPAPTNATK